MTKLVFILSMAIAAGFAYPAFAQKCEKGDCKEGKGVMTWSSGDRYEGEFRNGTMEYKGVMKWKNGDRYEGYWQKGKMHGVGTLTYANGDRYHGTFIRNKMNTYGTMTYANGTTYTGPWNDGIMEGGGTMTWKTGDKYEGGFKNNKRNGKGKMVWANGAVADGMWKDDVFQGDAAPKVYTSVPSSWDGDYALDSKPNVKALTVKYGKIYTVSGTTVVQTFPGKSNLNYRTTYSETECKQTAGTTVEDKFVRVANSNIKNYSSGSVKTYVKMK
jgi:hypothetical protein